MYIYPSSRIWLVLSWLPFSILKIVPVIIRYFLRYFLQTVIWVMKELLDIAPIFGKIVSELDLGELKMHSRQYLYLPLFVVESSRDLLLVLQSSNVLPYVSFLMMKNFEPPLSKSPGNLSK